jgi:hypothetical protein
MNKAQYLNELINSGMTLTKKEEEIVERHIWANQQQVSRRYLNTAKVRGMLNKGQ